MSGGLAGAVSVEAQLPGGFGFHKSGYVSGTCTFWWSYFIVSVSVSYLRAGPGVPLRCQDHSLRGQPGLLEDGFWCLLSCPGKSVGWLDGTIFGD